MFAFGGVVILRGGRSIGFRGLTVSLRFGMMFDGVGYQGCLVVNRSGLLVSMTRRSVGKFRALARLLGTLFSPLHVFGGSHLP